MKGARQIAFVIGVLVVGAFLVAMQIAAFAGPLPAPVPDRNYHTL